MKVAIPVCEGETATTFDFAGELLVVEYEGSREVHRSRIPIENALPANRANRLAELGVEVVICGAISRRLAAILLDLGMQLIPLVSGPVEEVLAAFLGDHLGEPRFLLPGCAPNERDRFLAHAARDSLRTDKHSIRLRRLRGHELDLPRR